MIFALIIHLSSGASSSIRNSGNDTCWRELKHFDEDGGAWKRVDPPCSDDRMHKVSGLGFGSRGLTVYTSVHHMFDWRGQRLLLP